MTIEQLRQEHPGLVAQVETAAVARAAESPATFEALDAAFGKADGAFVTEALRGRMTFAAAVAEFNKRQGERIAKLTDDLATARAELEQTKVAGRRPAKGEAPVSTVNAAAAAAGQPETFDAAVAAVAAEKGWSMNRPLDVARAKAEACTRYPGLYEQHRAEHFPRVAKSA